MATAVGAVASEAVMAGAAIGLALGVAVAMALAVADSRRRRPSVAFEGLERRR